MCTHIPKNFFLAFMIKISCNGMGKHVVPGMCSKSENIRLYHKKKIVIVQKIFFFYTTNQPSTYFPFSLTFHHESFFLISNYYFHMELFSQEGNNWDYDNMWYTTWLSREKITAATGDDLCENLSHADAMLVNGRFATISFGRKLLIKFEL
jgi:hypothetical protein